LLGCISFSPIKREGIGLENLDFTSILTWLWGVTPVVVGAAGGYLFYRFVGCKTGTCPITSSPWLSTIYGAILGLLFVAR
jgi:hypothetical protein